MRLFLKCDIHQKIAIHIIRLAKSHFFFFASPRFQLAYIPPFLSLLFSLPNSFITNLQILGLLFRSRNFNLVDIHRFFVCLNGEFRVISPIIYLLTRMCRSQSEHNLAFILLFEVPDVWISGSSFVIIKKQEYTKICSINILKCSTIVVQCLLSVKQTF